MKPRACPHSLPNMPPLSARLPPTSSWGPAWWGPNLSLTLMNRQADTSLRSSGPTHLAPAPIFQQRGNETEVNEEGRGLARSRRQPSWCSHASLGYLRFLGVNSKFKPESLRKAVLLSSLGEEGAGLQGFWMVQVRQDIEMP